MLGSLRPALPAPPARLRRLRQFQRHLAVATATHNLLRPAFLGCPAHAPRTECPPTPPSSLQPLLLFFPFSISAKYQILRWDRGSR